jgi:hypothetical protein
MPLLASEVMDESASVYLNDAAKIRWPHAVLLPYLRSAIGELQSELESNDLPPLYEIGAIIPVPAGETFLDLPLDFVFPVYLGERAPGETRFTDLVELSWEPDADPTGKLEHYVFREGTIQFLGSTANREVRLRYLRSLSAIVSENSVIEVANAKGFLAARTAGLASQFGGSATTRGNSANERAEYFKRLVISTITKRLQDRPVRRRRYLWRR